MVINPSFYMDLAINEAWKYQLLSYPNPAVGALILDANSKILSLNAHIKASKAHAELAAITSALFKQGLLNPASFKDQESELCFKKDGDIDFSKLDARRLYEFIFTHFKDHFKGASIYVTLEPCSHDGKTPPCAALLLRLGFKNVFISVMDPYSKGGIKQLVNAGVRVEAGVCKEKGELLLEPFLKWREKSFSFFKLALSLNGSALGSITRTKARAYAHKLRAASDVLVCGGQTLRLDRPKLDARLANAKAPDLVVLSRTHEYDLDIEALSVPNRRVFKSLPEHARLLMYEGGEEFLRAFAKECNWLLLMNNSSFNTQKALSLNLDLTLLHQGRVGKDSFSWLRIEKEQAHLLRTYP